MMLNWRVVILSLVCLLFGLFRATALEDSRLFTFPADAFAYTNQLSCEYQLDPTGTKMLERQRVPRPSYTLRCFVVARAARQFFQHARFEPGEPKSTPPEYRYLVRLVLQRSARSRKPDLERIVVPGYANLCEFSREYESLLKAECGGAWQSFVQRGNWRMVFPFSRRHQKRAAERLVAELGANHPPLVHVVCFPTLTLNHVLLIFGSRGTENGIEFSAYDPNRADEPITIHYDANQRAFLFPVTPYFPGGPVKLYEIYCGLCY